MSLLQHRLLLVKVLYFILLAAFLVLLIQTARRVRKFGWRRAFRLGNDSQEERTAIEFYERLLCALGERQLRRAPDQTPLEFAVGTGVNEAITITGLYNRVRFGGLELSAKEAKGIEEMLRKLEAQRKI